MPILDGYMTRPALAAELGVTTRTLERWERLRVGPPVTRAGRRPIYKIESALAWLKSRETPMVRDRGGDR